MKAPPLLRSVLFCPANEPRKVRRLSAVGADAAVLDLEDAVAVSEKESARTSAREALAELEGVYRAVRVNGFGTGLTADDVDAVVSADLDAIVLPKVEAAQDLRRIDRLLARAEAANGVAPGSIRVLAIIETCAGIIAAAEIAQDGRRLLSLAFGAGDLGNDLGLSTLQGDMTAALAYGRAKIVYDARAAGLPPPLDGPFMQVRDQVALEEDSRISRGLGHGGRICIHPDQVPVVNRIYAPDPNEVAFARRAIQAFADAERAGSAAITVDGTFVDYPVVHKARRLLALADAVAKAEGRRPTRT